MRRNYAFQVKHIILIKVWAFLFHRCNNTVKSYIYCRNSIRVSLVVNAFIQRETMHAFYKEALVGFSCKTLSSLNPNKVIIFKINQFYVRNIRGVNSFQV